MNIEGVPKNLDKNEIKRQLDEALAKVKRGELLGSQARITSGGVSISIKQARRYLGLPDEKILYAVQ